MKDQTEIGNNAIEHLKASLDVIDNEIQKKEIFNLIQRLEALQNGELTNIESTFVPTNNLRIILHVSAPSDMTIGEILQEVNELVKVANKTEGMLCKYKLDM